MSSSAAAREAQMRALRLALIGDESSCGSAVSANGGLDGVGDWCNGGTAAAGLRSRNSRRAVSRKPGNGNSASTAHAVPRAAGYGLSAANGGGLGPTPPSGPVRVGTPSNIASPRANGTESLMGGRSPRRFRVSSDQSTSLHNGRSSITPSPPTTPRSITPARPAPSSVDRGGGGGAVGSTPASCAFASQRTAETTSASACGVRDTPGGGKGSLGATHGENRATACNGGIVSRLRGASNNTRGHHANGASYGGVTAGHKEPQGASPPEFFQLSTRGVQPLSDVDFVHALLNVPGAASAAAGGGQSNTFTSAGARRGQSVHAW